jgi:hypothetical protein
MKQPAPNIALMYRWDESDPTTTVVKWDFREFPTVSCEKVKCLRDFKDTQKITRDVITHAAFEGAF